MSNQVVAYYDNIARTYDASRFGGSYGRYIDRQERRVLGRWLAPYRGERIVDIGCGTGRFLDLATSGVDPSAEMAGIAREKYPAVDIALASGMQLPFADGSIGAAFSMHVMMHLALDDVAATLDECARVIRPGGAFIFDAPTVLRRRLARHHQTGWHGATALSRRDVQHTAGPLWRLESSRGVLFFPIQRLPGYLRAALRPLDDLAGSTPLANLSSYSLHCLVRVP